MKTPDLICLRSHDVQRRGKKFVFRILAEVSDGIYTRYEKDR